MIKTAGVMLTAASMIAAGYYAASLVNKRISFLSSCISLIKQFSVDIGYCGMPVDILIKNAADNQELRHLNFIVDVRENLSDDFSCSWKSAVKSYFIRNLLPHGDMQMLLSFGEKLGTTDCEHQMKLCDEYINRFTQRYDEAVSKKNEHVKLFKSCGVVGALLIAVLFV